MRTYKISTYFYLLNLTVLFIIILLKNTMKSLSYLDFYYYLTKDLEFYIDLLIKDIIVSRDTLEGLLFIYFSNPLLADALIVQYSITNIAFYIVK